MINTRLSYLVRLAVPFAASAVFLGTLACAPSASAAVFRIKGSEPESGSRLKPVIGTSSIPLDRAAADLSDRERTEIRQTLDKLAAGDEPAYLDRALKPLIAELTNLRQRLNLQENLTAKLVIDETGQVRVTRVLDSTSDELTAVVRKALDAARFKPAQCAGVPCAIELPLSLEIYGNPVPRPQN